MDRQHYDNLRSAMTISQVETRVPELSLGAYLERIGFEGPVEPTSTVLKALQSRHLASIPFEDIDVLLGRTIGLDLPALQTKLIHRSRGGYCFEQNTLFAAVLRAIGFEVKTLEARVRPPDATLPLPRTHMVLAVEVDGREWLCDVGFGGDSSRCPVPFDGEVREQPDGAFRLEQVSTGLHVLRRRWRSEWADLYAYSSTPVLPVDFEVANHFTSTHPSSIFVQTLTVQRTGSTQTQILRGRTLITRRGEKEASREISDSELPDLLTRDFGLGLSAADLEALVEVTRQPG